MQQGVYEVDHRLVRRLASRAFDFIARLLFLPAPQIHEYHQHARFENVRIDRERFRERLLSALVIFRPAKPFEDAIDVTRAEPVVREREVWIELNSALEMLDRAVAIFLRQRAEDETRKQIAPAQGLFVRGWVASRSFAGADLLMRAQLDAQALDDALCDRVLKHDDV